MFYALDVHWRKIRASEAIRDQSYSCPICGEEVILKAGTQNIEHFAHKANGCYDNWNYDMY